MGDVTISTNDTTIYYPTDFLINSGPPFESMECPKPDNTDITEGTPSIIYNPATKYFGIVVQGFIVMESKNSRDIANYVGDYVMEFRDFVREQEQEQEAINGEAENAEDA